MRRSGETTHYQRISIAAPNNSQLQQLMLWLAKRLNWPWSLLQARQHSGPWICHLSIFRPGLYPLSCPQSRPEIVDLIEKIEHERHACRVELKIAFQALCLGDTDNTEARKLPL